LKNLPKNGACQNKGEDKFNKMLGQYYDNASNTYLIAIFTSLLFEENLIIHVNTAPKASYDLPLHQEIRQGSSIFIKLV